MFSFLPIATASTLFGLIGGGISAIFIGGLNFFLIYHQSGFSELSSPGVIWGTVFLVLVGIFIGRAVDNGRQAKKELSERRQIEEKLIEAETWYKNIFNGINDAIFVQRKNGEILDVNSRACEMYGLVREDFLGKRLEDLIAPTERFFWATKEKNLPEESFETICVNAKGIYFPVSISGHLQRIGDEERLLVVVRDITRQKLIEEENKRHNQFLSHVIESLPQPFYVINTADYSIAIANTAARGYNALDTETTCYALTHNRNAPCGGKEHPCPLQEVIKTRGVVITEHIHAIENGKIRYFEVYGYPVFDKRGNVSQMIEYALDITERKQVMTALEAAKEEAEAAANAKAAFLANMSHEIRTPLNAIYGMTSLLHDTPLNKEQEDFLKTIQYGSDTLLHVLNDVLDYSKIEAGKMSLEALPFNLHDCVKETIALLCGQAERAGLKLTYELEADVPEGIIGDITRLRQVLTNLLNNGIKFTKEGQIALRVRIRGNRGEKHEIQFSVQDTGIGIPQKDADKIFESFSQVDASTTRKYGGTGLGLTISKELVEKMGGYIWIESEEGVGSTFHFTILAEEAPDIIKATGNSSSDNDFSQKINEEYPLKILLVEDNKVNQKVALKMLERLGYQADLAENGIEALKRIEEKKYELVLMDIQMPKMDGREATARVRAEVDADEQPYIVAMTAHALEGDRAKYLAYGMDNYISKPIKVNDLRALLLLVRKKATG